MTEVLLLCNALLLAIALLVIVRFRRDLQAFVSFWHSPVGASLAGTQDAPPTSAPSGSDSDERQRLADTTTRLEQQLLMLRRDMYRQTVSDGPAAKPPASGGQSLPIENAVRMARHGASVEELRRSCGLSLGEARLMLKLHGKSQRMH